MNTLLKKNGMSTLVNKSANVKASTIWFSNDMLYVRLEDGREIGVPLLWFPRLRKANQVQLNNWRFIGNGIGIHWESLDEDISISALL
ncbi:MAG: DUF2442 domain-containing protein [Candidatus Paceibacterota bacterium]